MRAGNNKAAALALGLLLGSGTAAHSQEQQGQQDEAPAPVSADAIGQPAPGDAAAPAGQPAQSAPSGSPAPESSAPPPDASTIPVKTDEKPKPIVAERAQLEDITVTAQKRVQSIQDVPISMSAINSQYMQEQGLTDIRDAMMLMPNVKMEEAGFFMAPRVRGFTFNNNNKAFEPPVGIVVDGVPYTRPEYFMMTLFDADRLEVMRGPQGTTFGKNTTAGLVHLMTKDPTSSPEGDLQMQGGELNRKHIEAAYGGPMGDFLDFRVAALYDERDGFIKNTTGQAVQGAPMASKNRKRTGGRAKLAFPEIFGGSLKVGVESVSMLSGGAGFEYVKVSPDFNSICKDYDPNFDSTPGNWVASEDLPGVRDVHINTANLNWNSRLGPWDLVGIGAYSVMKQTLSLDTDFTPAPAVLGFGGDTSPTGTFELRTASPKLDGLLGLTNILGWNPGSSDVLFGVFYERRAILDSIFRFGVNDGPLLQLVQGANGNSGTGLGGVFGGLTAADVQQSYEEVVQHFDQHAQALGAFSQVKWQFLPKWAWEVGVRYTTEKKDADWHLYYTTPPPNAVMGRLGFIPFTDALTRKESNVQPKIALDYALTDTVNLFAHWTRGFKGGGYNAFAYRNVGDDGVTHTTKDLQYKPEITTEKGFDIKTRLFSNTVHANLSLYEMIARDFQVLIRNNPPGTIGLGTTAVQNAEGARARGAEADVTWLAAEWLNVIATTALNATKYLSFNHNECPSDTPSTQVPCDSTGKRFPYAPLWSNTLSLVATVPFSQLPLGNTISNSGLELFSSVTGEHETWSYLDTDLDSRPEKVQPEFYRLKANLGIGSPAKRWSVHVIGENLNNAKTWIRCGDIFAGEVACSQNEPRLVFAQFRQDF